MIERLYEMLQEKELEMHLRSFERILFLVSQDEMQNVALHKVHSGSSRPSK